jgi:Arc/MetJ-type ribon-helix-helix transcriptional regulator
MSLVLSKEDEAVIERLIATGKFRSPQDVVKASLLKLEHDSQTPIESFPPGSLAHLYTAENNAEELALFKI